MNIKPEIITWLLNSDPAIRWQVMQDLQDLREATYIQERQKLVEKGWCAELLRLQDKDGLGKTVKSHTLIGSCRTGEG